MQRHAGEFENELERAVFSATYGSHEQRLWRVAACSLLVIKHALRGILFSWPLYLLAIGTLFLPNGQALVFALLFFFGVLVSGYILGRGVREDYVQQVKGAILKPGDVFRLLTPGV